MRGSGKYNLQLAYYQAALLGTSFSEVKVRGRNITILVHDDVYIEPILKPQLTDYDPRGADRIKGPKGPRNRWGKQT